MYVVWGSTYLAIRIVVEEAPPLTSMGLRYSTAALILAAILMLRGGPRRLRINRRQAVGTAFLGLMLPLLGNGMVSVAEDRGARGEQFGHVGSQFAALRIDDLELFFDAQGEAEHGGIIYLTRAGMRDAGCGVRPGVRSAGCGMRKARWLSR